MHWKSSFAWAVWEFFELGGGHEELARGCDGFLEMQFREGALPAEIVIVGILGGERLLGCAVCGLGQCFVITVALLAIC
jgi:hypothetical protein